MRSEKVRVRSAADNRVLTHISEREARLMCGEDSHGNSLDGVQATAMRLSKKKEALRDIKLLHPMRADRTSPCTITMGDAVNNAFAHSGLGLDATDSIRALDRSISKIDAWPEVHDDRNLVISSSHSSQTKWKELRRERPLR